MAPLDARAFLILLASSGNQATAAAALGCSGAAVSRRLAEARKALGDEEALALIEKHKRDEAAGVNLRKPFIMGTTVCGVCGGERTRQPSGKLRCSHCRNAQYRAAHPMDPTLEVLTPEEASTRFVIKLAQEGTQSAAAKALAVSQPVVSERLKKARGVLGDERVIELLKAHQKDAKFGQNLLKTFYINSPTCRQCGHERTPLGTTGELVCRHCSNLRNQEYKARHPDRIKAAAADYRANNADAIRDKGADYRAAHPNAGRDYYLANAERIKARVAAHRALNRLDLNRYQRLIGKLPHVRLRKKLALGRWKKLNPHKVAEDNVRRAVAIWRQRPAWASKTDMHAIYALARLRTALTGFLWVVDHIVPLNSERVCGLHCEANLQVIPAVTNAVKLNLWWPDMPDATPDCVTFAERPSHYLTPPAGPAPFLRAAYYSRPWSARPSTTTSVPGKSTRSAPPALPSFAAGRAYTSNEFSKTSCWTESP